MQFRYARQLNSSKNEMRLLLLEPAQNRNEALRAHPLLIHADDDDEQVEAMQLRISDLLITGRLVMCIDAVCDANQADKAEKSSQVDLRAGGDGARLAGLYTSLARAYVNQGDPWFYIESSAAIVIYNFATLADQ